MISLNMLAKIINREFAPPFLEEGTVEAGYRVKKGMGYLAIRIGRRDIEIDEEGTVVGAGTRVQGKPDISDLQDNPCEK